MVEKTGIDSKLDKGRRSGLNCHGKPHDETNHLILVVDDDEDLRESFAGVLEDAGYEAASAGNGREALDFLRSSPPPCLVLLDLMMPVMDGLSFITEKEADSELANIPVVVITAAAGSRLRSIAPRPVLPNH